MALSEVEELEMLRLKKRKAESEAAPVSAAPAVDPDIPQPSAPMTPPTMEQANPAISPQAGAADSPQQPFMDIVGKSVEGTKQAVQGTAKKVEGVAKDPNLTLGQKVKNIGSDAVGGAVANLAAVPVLGGAGRVASAIPQLGNFGRAVSGVSSAMKAQGPAALAAEGAVIGGTMRSVVDMLKDRYGVSEEAANNIVMASSLSPVAAQKAWSSLPTRAKNEAMNIIKAAHSAGTKAITSVEQSNAMQKILDNLGMGGTLKEETNPLNAALEAAAKMRQGEIGKEGKELASKLEKEAGVMGRVTSESMPQQAELFRERKLGPDVTKSDVADEIRMLTVPEAAAAADARQAEGRQGWDALKAVAEQKMANNQYPNQTKEAQDVVGYLNSLIEPIAGHPSTLDPRGPIYNQLKNWRDRLMGQKVAPLPVKAPNIRKLVSEYSAKLRQSGGYVSEDELQQWMRQENWLPDHVADNAMRNKPGGDIDAAKAILKQAQENRETDPVIHMDDASDWATYQYETQQWNSAVANAPYRTSLEEYDLIRREANQMAKDAKGGLKGSIETEARKISERVTKALEEFAPGFSDKRLLDYHDAALDEAEFKTRLAKALNERDPADPNQMKTGAHRVTEMVFAGRDPAMAFKRMINGDQTKFDKIGLAHINTSLSGKDAAAAKAWWESSATKDWKGELSESARKRVDEYIKGLGLLDSVSKQAATREKSTLGQLEKLPGITEGKIGESNKLLMGSETGENPKATDRIRNLFMTQKPNTAEVRAVWDSVKNTPEGKKAFTQAVESVLKEEMQGAGSKDILTTFDNRIHDVLVQSGAYTAEEAGQLRNLVKAVNEIAKTKVASLADYKDLIRDATNSESMKKSALAGLVGGTAAIAGATAGATLGGHSLGIPGGVSGGLLGGLVAGKEAFGLFSSGGYARYQKYLEDAISKIIADPELFKAAIAPESPYSTKRLMSMLAARSAQAGVINEANRLERPIDGRRVSILEKRAEGGPVVPGKPYVVGEKGPEVIVPQAGGTVIPTNQIQKALGLTGMPTQGFKMNGLNPDGSYGNQPVAPVAPAQGVGTMGTDSKMVQEFKQRQAAAKFEHGVQQLMQLQKIPRPMAEAMIRARGQK